MMGAAYGQLQSTEKEERWLRPSLARFSRMKAHHALVRIDVLQKFDELVDSLGGDASQLLSESGLHRRRADKSGQVSYEGFIRLLELAAHHLGCSDFGIRLAQLQGGGGKVMGPIELVMKNSQTIREAFNYCSEHIQVYSPVTRFLQDRTVSSGHTAMLFDILLDDTSQYHQAVEHALMATHLLARDVSNGSLVTRKVWFRHRALSTPAVYRTHFGCPVQFGERLDGVLYRDADLERPIENPDRQLYEMATAYIEARFPASDLSMKGQVRLLVLQVLDSGSCTHEDMAHRFGITGRTLQRRLREEGTSFEEIKDGVRREIAIECLRRPEVPFSRIAEMLGYSESSVFSRSCQRWFSMTARDLRQLLSSGKPPAKLDLTGDRTPRWQ